MISIEEGNKLIALFCGAIDETGYFQASTIGKTKVPTGRLYMTERFPDNMHLCIGTDLKYHSSWDWLMPVVEKISDINIKGIPPFNSDQFVRVEIIPHGYVRISNFRDTPIFTNVSIEGSLIAAVFKAVIQFIQWYTTKTTLSV